MTKICAAPGCGNEVSERAKTCSMACRVRWSRYHHRHNMEQAPPMLYVNPAEIITPRPLRQSDVPDCVFPSANEYGIPTLTLDMQAKWLDLPFVRWGGDLKRESKMKGTFNFFTDDRRFPFHKIAYQVINAGAKMAVEANFSIGSQTPLARTLYQIYQKRWLSWYWSIYDIKIIVDMHVPTKFYSENLLGVPQGWQAYATRGKKEVGEVLADYNAALAHAGTERLGLFVVYEGGAKVRELAQEFGWFYFDREDKL